MLRFMIRCLLAAHLMCLTASVALADDLDPYYTLISGDWGERQSDAPVDVILLGDVHYSSRGTELNRYLAQLVEKNRAKQASEIEELVSLHAADREVVVLYEGVSFYEADGLSAQFVLGGSGFPDFWEIFPEREIQVRGWDNQFLSLLGGKLRESGQPAEKALQTRYRNFFAVHYAQRARAETKGTTPLVILVMGGGHLYHHDLLQEFKRRGMTYEAYVSLPIRKIRASVPAEQTTYEPTHPLHANHLGCTNYVLLHSRFMPVARELVVGERLAPDEKDFWDTQTEALEYLQRYGHVTPPKH